MKFVLKSEVKIGEEKMRKTTQQKVKKISSPEQQIARYYKRGKVEILPSQNNPSDREIVYSITSVSSLRILNLDINLIKEE